eukprot:758241-Hanusia_phi.AAC.7
MSQVLAEKWRMVDCCVLVFCALAQVRRGSYVNVLLSFSHLCFTLPPPISSLSPKSSLERRHGYQLISPLSSSSLLSSPLRLSCFPSVSLSSLLLLQALYCVAVAESWSVPWPQLLSAAAAVRSLVSLPLSHSRSSLLPFLLLFSLPNRLVLTSPSPPLNLLPGLRSHRLLVVLVLVLVLFPSPPLPHLLSCSLSLLTLRSAASRSLPCSF